jgi:hypothetical protein
MVWPHPRWWQMIRGADLTCVSPVRDIASAIRCFLSSTILLSLLPAIAFSAAVHKRHVYHCHGYGFLPGYHQPPNNSVPVSGSRGSIRGTQAIPQAIGITARGTISAIPGFSRTLQRQ